jgi:hypothetical protein
MDRYLSGSNPVARVRVPTIRDSILRWYIMYNSMADSASSPEPAPDKTDPIPDSYAIYVTGSALHVWQYRHSIFEPDGK